MSWKPVKITMFRGLAIVVNLGWVARLITSGVHSRFIPKMLRFQAHRKIFNIWRDRHVGFLFFSRTILEAKCFWPIQKTIFNVPPPTTTISTICKTNGFPKIVRCIKIVAVKIIIDLLWLSRISVIHERSKVQDLAGIWQKFKKCQTYYPKPFPSLN